jgi:nucleotide-binding universal stress UspA family protein
LAAKGDHGPVHSLRDWCVEHQADLPVMDAFGHTPGAERWLGGTTWTVFTTARLPVLMSC